MSQIEALYIFDEHNNPILEHVWHGRPPSAKAIIPFYLACPAPRPSVTYLTETNPPSVLFSIIHGRLLFLCPSSSEIDPLLVLEFLHRVGDVLEDSLGAPLVASKIEAAYDVVALLLGEMCDAGLIDRTEPNALREAVDAPSRMTKFLDSVGLPGAAPSLSSSSSPSLGSFTPKLQDTPTIPWRKANVYHTSNELYVDMIETLHVITAPSGRLLSARANGTIAMNCKVSGVPDLLLLLGGKKNLEHTMQLPMFHPCVRLAHWRERPGELSFVPPDGRFVLAGYEVDLLGKDHLEQSFKNPKFVPNLELPVKLEIRTELGDTAAEFEVRLLVNKNFASASLRGQGPPSGFAARSLSGTSALPILEDLVVSVPMPPGIRNISDMRASKGDATYSPGDSAVEWRISIKHVEATPNATFTLRCTVLGPPADEVVEVNNSGPDIHTNTWDYDDTAAYQAAKKTETVEKDQSNGKENAGRPKQSALLMPTTAVVSFSVKGWLASELKVQKLLVDVRKSRGLGRGVEPSKGVKYLTVSRKGVELRC